MVGFKTRFGSNTKKLVSRIRNGALAAAFVAVQVISPIVLLNAKATAATTNVTNPSLATSCGLDIAIVVDNSTSISDTEMGQMKGALTTFTNALNGTPTQFSVTRFASSATVLQGFTSNVSTVNSAINGIPTGGGFTNWEDGLKKAASTLPNRTNPDLVLFATDGDPTASSAGSNDTNQPNAHLAPAVTQANSIKTNGARILTLGIGLGSDAGSVSRLQAISGPNTNTGNVLTSDVITTNFSTLATELATFAKQTCGGTITTKKIIDQDGNLNTTGDQSVASGWTFDINGSPSDPAATQTNASGLTPAVKVDAGTYSVNETQQAGYELLSAGCTGAASNGSKNGNAVTGISVANENIVSCTFINTPSRGSVQVMKKLDADGNGTYESGNSEAQGLNMFWKLDGGANTTFGGIITGQTVGNHQVTETSPAGYHFTGWYNSSNQQQSCANPAGTTLPVTVSVSANLTSGITLCNARDTGTIKVIKKVINDNGGSLSASDFTTHVKTGGSDVTGSPAAGSTTGKTYTLPTGTYSVSEDAAAGYTQVSITCLNENLQTVAQPVVLGNNQNVTCTIVNDDKAPSITVVKNVSNPYGTPLSVASFPLYVDGSSVTSGSTYTSFNAGYHTITESQQSGYELTNVSGDCYQDKGGSITTQLTLGNSSTCTLTNTAIQPKLIVTKKVINDNSGEDYPSNFTMTVTGNSATVPNFPGNASGTTVGLNEGSYTVGELSHNGYTQTLVGDCSGTISIGQVKTCLVINDDIPHPSIQVNKYGPATAFEGDTVHYTFKVTNTGDTDLSGISLSDDIAVNESCPSTTLARYSSMWCTAEYTIPTPQVADVTNHVTVTGYDPDETKVTDTDSHTLDVLHNSIKVVKTGPSTATAGSKVTYTFTVTNAGDQALSAISVSDNIAGNGVYKSGDTDLDHMLDTNETWIYTADYTIPANQTAPVVNTVKACGNYSTVLQNPEWDDEVVLERVSDGPNQIIVQPKATVCATDSHTTNISVVLGSSTTVVAPPAILGVTGQESYATILAVVAITSGSLAGLMLVTRKR